MCPFRPLGVWPKTAGKPACIIHASQHHSLWFWLPHFNTPDNKWSHFPITLKAALYRLLFYFFFNYYQLGSKVNKFGVCERVQGCAKADLFHIYWFSLFHHCFKMLVRLAILLNPIECIKYQKNTTQITNVGVNICHLHTCVTIRLINMSLN